MEIYAYYENEITEKYTMEELEVLYVKLINKTEYSTF